MTQQAPEPMAVRADVTVTAHIDVRVEGPAGLVATLRVPDDEEAYDALIEFVTALPQTIDAAMVAAEERADG